MRRLTAGGIALFAMTWAGSAFALGLGEIDVRSHLNEGFLAVVPVVGATETDLEYLGVQLAGGEEFARAGLERGDYLSTLKFSVDQAPDGTAQLKIRSNELAREPFLSFVIEVRWNGGKLVREYTALLDPPVAAPAPSPKPAPTPKPAAPAQAVDATPAAVPPPTPVTPAAGELKVAGPDHAESHHPASQVPVSDAESAAGSYGPVAANETLWSIATRLQPNLGGTLDQILVALYQKNPAAFEGGSIDRVMKGVKLSTPSAAELRAINPIAARHKLAELRGLAPATSEQKPERPAVPASAPAPVPAPAPAEEPAPAKPAAAAKPEAAKPEVVKPAPAVQPPAPIESPNLKGILPSEGAKPVPAPPTPAPAAAPPPATTPPVVEAPAVTPPAAPEASAPAAAPKLPSAPVVEPPKPVAVTDAGNDLPLPLPALGGIGALLLGALAFLLVRRRRAAAENAAGAMMFAEAPRIGGPGEDPHDVLLEASAPTGMDAETLLKPLVPPAPAPAAQVPEPEKPEPLQPDQPEFEQATTETPSALSVAPEAADPLADADFHLSYGLHEEAANILRAALAKAPTRLDLKLKLADVYFAGRRGLEFQELAEQLRPQVDTTEWKHLVELGRQLVPNAPIFKPTMSAPTFGGGLGDLALDEFDLGGDSTPPLAEPEPIVAAQPTKAPALDLSSFDLASGDDGKPERVEFNLDELDLAKHEEGEPSFTLGDEFDTKLDLARAYADMGDSEAALNLLTEVVTGGNEKQKLEAKTLHDRLKG